MKSFTKFVKESSDVKTEISNMKNDFMGHLDSSWSDPKAREISKRCSELLTSGTTVDAVQDPKTYEYSYMLSTKGLSKLVVICHDYLTQVKGIDDSVASQETKKLTMRDYVVIFNSLRKWEGSSEVLGISK